MTDARFPERWLADRRLLRLSDAEFRTFVMSLAWSVSNRTDGRLEQEDLDLIPGCRRAVTPAMVKAGLWKATDGGFEIVDFANTQTSRDELQVLENVRRANREAQQRRRLGNKGKPDSQPDSQPDVSMTREHDDIGRQEGRKAGKDNKNLPDEEPSETEQPRPPALVPAGLGWDECPTCGWLLDSEGHRVNCGAAA